MYNELEIAHLYIVTLFHFLKGQIFITLGLRPKDDAHTYHLPERQDKTNLLISHTYSYSKYLADYLFCLAFQANTSFGLFSTSR